MLTDTNLEDNPKTCLPSPNPSSSLKVKAVKTPQCLIWQIVTSMVKVNKWLNKCDDQHDRLQIQMSNNNKSHTYHVTTKTITEQVYNGVKHKIT